MSGYTMSSETGARKTVRDRMQAIRGLHWTRVEGALTPGIPDINMCYKGVEAWIEAKEVDSWPKRSSTIVNIGLRPEQRIWLEERAEAGGRCFVLAKIGNEWFLWNGWFGRIFHGLRQDELRNLACWHCGGALDVESFIECVFGIVLEVNR